MPYVRSEPTTLIRRRRWVGRVSGSAKKASANISKAAVASTTKIPRQDMTVSSALPSDGATIGPTPSTSINRENSCAARTPVNRSRTIAIEITATAAPARPCRKRAAISSWMLGARAHSTDIRACRTSPASSGLRRPIASDNGPMSN